MLYPGLELCFDLAPSEKRVSAGREVSIWSDDLSPEFIALLRDLEQESALATDS